MLDKSQRGTPFESNKILKKMWLEKAKEAKLQGLEYKVFMKRAASIDYGYKLNDNKSKSFLKKCLKISKIIENGKTIF